MQAGGHRFDPVQLHQGLERLPEGIGLGRRPDWKLIARSLVPDTLLFDIVDRICGWPLAGSLSGCEVGLAVIGLGGQRMEC